VVVGEAELAEGGDGVDHLGDVLLLVEVADAVAPAHDQVLDEQVAQGVGGVLLGDGDAGPGGEFPFPVGGDGLAGLGVLAGGEDGGAVAAYPVGVVEDGEGDGARAARQVEPVGEVVAGQGGLAVGEQVHLVAVGDLAAVEPQGGVLRVVEVDADGGGAGGRGAGRGDLDVADEGGGLGRAGGERLLGVRDAGGVAVADAHDRQVAVLVGGGGEPAGVGAGAFAADVEPGLAVVAAAGLERLGVVAGVGGGLAGCVPVGGDAAAVGGVQGVVVGGGFGGGLGVGGVAGREGEGQVVVAGVADAEGAAVGFAGGDAAGGHGYEVVLDVVEGGAFGAGDEVFAPQVGLGGQGDRKSVV